MLYKGAFDGLLAGIIDDLPLTLAVDFGRESVGFVGIDGAILPISVI